MNLLLETLVIFAVIVQTSLQGAATDDTKVTCFGTDYTRKTNIPRVYGGTPAILGQISWQSRTAPAKGNPNQPACNGGTIIHDNWVISAAHCFYDATGAFMTGPWQVHVGGIKMSTLSSGEQIIPVDRVVIHDRYSHIAENFDYDFALLHLQRPISWTQNIKSACLLNNCTGEVDASVMCVISGWGLTSQTANSLSDVLYMAMVPIPPRSDCVRSDHSEDPDVTERMVCAGYLPGQQGAGQIDTCQGDGGGPMACPYGASGKMVLHGITSWGKGCAVSGSLGVYARPCSVIDWIKRLVFGGKTTVTRPTPTPMPTTQTKPTAPTTSPSTACGIRRRNQTNKADADVGDFPWLVRLVIYGDNSHTQVTKTCAGSLIDNQWILTSAQCFLAANIEDSNIVVQFAVTNTNLPVSSSINRTATRHESHSQYDFALLQLSSPVTFTDNIRPVCLPTVCDQKPRSATAKCGTAGWRTIFSNNGGETKMKKAVVALASADSCRTFNVGGNSYSGSYDNYKLCAIERQSNLRCLSDIGGPLMCSDDTSNTFTIYGVATSAPSGCPTSKTASNAYVIFSNPCSVYDWIQSTTQQQDNPAIFGSSGDDDTFF